MPGAAKKPFGGMSSKQKNAEVCETSAFFEKELLYCKLTVASTIQKGLLHVSFGAVGSWSFAMLKQGLVNLGTFQKDLIGLCEVACYVSLLRGLQNLESPLKRF